MRLLIAGSVALACLAPGMANAQAKRPGCQTTGSAVLKGNGSGGCIGAVSGTDYLSPSALGGLTTISASGSSQTLTAIASSQISFVVTLTANCVFTLSGGSSGSTSTITVYLKQDSTAGRTVSFGSNVTWQNNVAPQFNTSAGYYDVVQFTTIDGGTTYNGVLVASQVAAPTTPGVPVGVVATPGNGQNIITATGLLGLPTVTGYTIYRGTTPGGESGTPIVTNTTLPYFDNGVTNGTTYYYKIAGVNSLGTGSQSAEVSATPSVISYGHYAQIGSGGYGFTAFSNSFNPGSNPFSITSYSVPTSATPIAYAPIISQWYQGHLDVSAFLFGITTTGKLDLNWGISSSTFGECTSSVNPGYLTNIPLWTRVDANPTTGVCTFYVGGNSPPVSAGGIGPVWTQLGSPQTSGTTGPVQTITTTTLILAETYGGDLFFLGKMYQASLSINGTLITNPVATVPTDAFVDPQGFVYTNSGSGLVWN